MSRVMEQGDFRPMAQNREAMADLVAILEARRADYARAQAELDTSGDTVEASFAKLRDGDLRGSVCCAQAGSSRGYRRTSDRYRMQAEHRHDDKLADHGFLDLGADAARIPHDRPAPGCGADAS